MFEKWLKNISFQRKEYLQQLTINGVHKHITWIYKHEPTASELTSVPSTHTTISCRKWKDVKLDRLHKYQKVLGVSRWLWLATNAAGSGTRGIHSPHLARAIHVIARSRESSGLWDHRYMALVRYLGLKNLGPDTLASAIHQSPLQAVHAEAKLHAYEPPEP